MHCRSFKVLLGLGMVILAQEAGAQTGYSAGSLAFPMLSIGLGARAVGMGESFTAVADDLSALQYNPAGLGQVKAVQLGLNHNSYLDTGFYDTLGLVYPLGDTGTLGGSLNYLNYGSIDQRDSQGNLQGSYSPFDFSANGAFGFKLDKGYCLGLSSQWIRQDINGNAHTGLLLNAGFLARPVDDRLTFGLNLKNLGVDSGGSNLPSGLSAGAAYRLKLDEKEVHSLLLSLGGDWSFQGVSRLVMGIEYALEKNYFLRCGYSRDLQDIPLDSVKGLDFGVGVRLGEFQFDYSFSFLGELGNVNRFSLSLFLASPEKPSAEAKAAPAVPTGQAVPPPDSFYLLPPENKPGKPVVLKFQVKSDEGLTAQQLFNQAEEKRRRGLKQEALDLYLKAVEKDPNFQQAWMSLGKLYFDKSLESYRKVLEMDPKNEKLREWLGHFKP